jgi:hypothetical protein
MGGSNCACSNGNTALDQAVAALINAQKANNPINPASACASQQFPTCPVSLVSPATEQLLRSANRTVTSPIAIALVAPGASAPALVLPSDGLPRVIMLSDLIASLTSLDEARIVVTVGGQVKVDIFGGRFARGNANDCTTSCGLGVCAGPIEAVTVTVTNQSGLAWLATATMTLQTRTIYTGEPGYDAVCGACMPAGAGGAPGGATF